MSIGDHVRTILLYAIWSVVHKSIAKGSVFDEYTYIKSILRAGSTPCNINPVSVLLVSNTNCCARLDCVNKAYSTFSTQANQTPTVSARRI